MTDNVIVRDFAFTDARHYGVYPTKVMDEKILLPIQGSDLLEILSRLSLELTELMQRQISLSLLVSDVNHVSQSELEMDVQSGQELIVINQEVETQKEYDQTGSARSDLVQCGGDRWASMDDDLDQQAASLEIKYEPELKDFAQTIQGFQKAQFPAGSWLLCLKLRTEGHLEGVGNTIRGEAKVELEDIGLVPKQK